MSENTEDFSDNEEISETLETEDVVDTTDELCEISNLLSQRKQKKIVEVEKSKRISKNQMTKYELVRIIGERTAQLTRGAKPLIKLTKDSDQLSYKELAIEELKMNMVPMKIKRPVGNHYEIWEIKELEKDHLMNLLN